MNYQGQQIQEIFKNQLIYKIPYVNCSFSIEARLISPV